MNPTVEPQHQNGYNQFFPADLHTAPPASQYERRSPGNIAATSQPSGHPGTQATAHPGPQLALGLASPQRYPLYSQLGAGYPQPSAQQPPQHFSSTTSCQYPPSTPEHNLASLQRPPRPQYTSSQTGHQNPLLSNSFRTPTSYNYPVSHKAYREEDNTISFGGFQGSVSSNDLRSHNGGNSSGYSAADLSNQNSQGSIQGRNSASIGRYGHGQTQWGHAGQNTMSQIDASLGVDPSENFQDLCRNGVANEYYRLNGMRVSLHLSVSTDERV